MSGLTPTSEYSTSTPTPVGTEKPFPPLSSQPVLNNNNTRKIREDIHAVFNERVSIKE